MATKKRISTNRNKTKAREVFSVRFSEEELGKLRVEAERRGATIAGVVRSVVVESFNPSKNRTTLLNAHSTSDRSTLRIYGKLAEHVEIRSSAA